MGRFVNPDNSAFQVALNSRIYVDNARLKNMRKRNCSEPTVPRGVLA